jgi:hypothetical protein
MQLENEQLERLDCLVTDCPEVGREYWYLKTPAGMVERYFCYAHALDYRPADKAAFGDAYVPGSDEGEA